MTRVSLVNRGRSILLGLVATCLLSTTAWAQTQYGTIQGHITDQSGAAIVGATVKATNQDSHLGFSTTSSEIGDYMIGGLLPGLYTVTAEMSGFKLFKVVDRPLSTDQIVRVDISLQVGNAHESVTVEAKATLLNTETASVAQEAPQKLMEMPANLRHLVWAPSETVTPNLPGEEYAAGTAITAYGSRSYDRMTTLDGTQINISNFRPPRGSVEAVDAEDLNSGPAYQTSQTIDMITTKGTNLLHGEIWTELWNQALVANPYAGGPRPPGIPNVQYGFSVGGPVYLPRVYNGKNKTFFFFAYDKLPRNSGQPNEETAPTAAMEAGNFTGTGVTIIDPLTQLPFPNNTIPSGRISPVASKLISQFYPPPPSIFSTNNTEQFATEGQTVNDYLIRLDQQLGAKNTVSVTYMKNNITSYQSQDTTAVATSFAATGELYTGAPVHLVNVSDAWILSPEVLNEAHFGYDTQPSSTYLSANGTQIMNSIGLPIPAGAPNITGGPDFYVYGMNGVAFDNPSSSAYKIWNVRDTFTVTKSRYTTKVGLEIISPKTTSVSYGNVYGTYNFDGLFTTSPFADFLLGLPNTTSVSLPPPTTTIPQRQMGIYGEEDVKVTQKLSLSLGLRYQHNGVPYEIHGLQYNFDLATGDLVVPSSASLAYLNPGLTPAITSSIVTAQAAGYPTHLINPLTGWDPRIGIAYRGFANTVFRVGYGRFDTLNAYGAFTGGPFTPGNQDYTNRDNCTAPGTCAPLFSLANAFPGGGTVVVGGLSVAGVIPNLKTPSTDQWNVSVEHALPQKISLRVSYIGSKSTQLPYRRNANLPPASLIPFTPSRLRFPNWSNITYGDDGGDETYHSLEIEATHRFASGLWTETNFRWAKALTDVDEQGFEYGWGPAGTYGETIQNPYDRAAQKGNVSVLPRLKLKSSFLYELPLGRGKPFLGHLQGVGGSAVNHVVGGWTVSGVFIRQDGWWYTPFYTGDDASNTGNTLITPNRIGSGVAPHRDGNHMFNPADFSTPTPGTYGNAGFGIIQGLPATWLDANVWKQFRLVPGKEWSPKMQIGMTSSNILNHPAKNGYGESPWTVNSPSTAGIANDYYYTNVTTGGSGSWRIIRFDIAIVF